MDATEIGQALVRIQSEFLEHPGLRLTTAEVERLCAVHSKACEALIAVLVDAGVLHRLPDGSLMHSVRPTDPRAVVRHGLPFAGVEFRPRASLVRARRLIGQPPLSLCT
jgi:hypothetical protein